MLLVCTSNVNLAGHSHEQTIAARPGLSVTKKTTVVSCVQGMTWSRRFEFPAQTCRFSAIVWSCPLANSVLLLTQPPFFMSANSKKIVGG